MTFFNINITSRKISYRRILFLLFIFFSLINPIPLILLSIMSQQQQQAFFYQIYQRIKSSLLQSVHNKQEQNCYNEHDDTSIIDKQDTTTALTPFQKTYVSFPEFESIGREEEEEQVITTTITAFPSFYNTPHFKPIWIC